jgi:hypothetical protein
MEAIKTNKRKIDSRYDTSPGRRWIINPELGKWDVIEVWSNRGFTSREAAEERVRDIKDGLFPVDPRKTSFEALMEELRVRAKRRSEGEG